MGPHLVQCGLDRGPPQRLRHLDPFSRLHAKFYLDPSNRLATIHQRFRQDRQTDNGLIAKSKPFYKRSLKNATDLLVPQHNHTTTILRLFFWNHPGEPVDFMVQGKINRGRHTDHPAVLHSIRTNQCPPPPSSPYFFTGQMPFLPPNQQRQNTVGKITEGITQ